VDSGEEPSGWTNGATDYNETEDDNDLAVKPRVEAGNMLLGCADAQQMTGRKSLVP
jgi:hypothetical protein